MTFTARESAEVQLLFAQSRLQDLQRQRNALVLSGASANTKGGVKLAGKRAGGAVGAGLGGAVNLFVAEAIALIEPTELDVQIYATETVVKAAKRKLEDLAALDSSSSTTLDMPAMWHRDP